MKEIFTLETKLSRRFESNKQDSALLTANPDAQFKYYDAPYIQYEKITLNDLYKQYLETALLSKKNI